MFESIKEVVQRDACAYEDWLSVHGFWIFVDDGHIGLLEHSNHKHKLDSGVYRPSNPHPQFQPYIWKRLIRTVSRKDYDDF